MDDSRTVAITIMFHFELTYFNEVKFLVDWQFFFFFL